jgi:hypothetical protein
MLLDGLHGIRFIGHWLHRRQEIVGFGFSTMCIISREGMPISEKSLCIFDFLKGENYMNFFPAFPYEFP